MYSNYVYECEWYEWYVVCTMKILLVYGLRSEDCAPEIKNKLCNLLHSIAEPQYICF